MALPILDGNQSATTLSSILTSGEHVPAHTVVSLGTQAITDIRGAVSGSVVSISNFPATQTIAGTVTVGNSLTIQSGNISIEEVFGENSFVPISGTVTIGSALPAGTNRIGVVTIGNIQRSGDGAQSSLTTEVGSGYLNTRSYIGEGTAQIGSVTASISGTVPISISSVTIGNSVTIGSLPLIAGTVTANVSGTIIDPREDYGVATEKLAVQIYGTSGNPIGGLSGEALPISGTVTVGNSVTIASLPALAAGTAQIGSVTASISNSVTIASFATSVTARLINPAGTAVTYAEVGTAGSPSIDVLSVQGVTSGTPLTILNHQGTTVTTSNFTSTTASTVLASANSTREVLTIFNEGAGNLHICAGATCTTIAYQVRLSAGDYYEVPLNQTSLTHSAVFATAGTARVTEVS